MSFPPFPSNGEINWGNKMQTWSDAVEDQKVQGPGMTLRRNTGVGERILLDHQWGTIMLYGDTGWRDITDSLTNGWTADSIHIRRVNSNVYFRYKNLSSKNATTPAAFNINYLFTPSANGTTTPLTLDGLATLSTMRIWSGNTTIPLVDFSTGIAGGAASWETDRAWPAVLPGTPD